MNVWSSALLGVPASWYFVSCSKRLFRLPRKAKMKKLTSSSLHFGSRKNSKILCIKWTTVTTVHLYLNNFCSHLRSTSSNSKGVSALNQPLQFNDFMKKFIVTRKVLSKPFVAFEVTWWKIQMDMWNEKSWDRLKERRKETAWNMGLDRSNLFWSTFHFAVLRAPFEIIKAMKQPQR